MNENTNQPSGAGQPAPLDVSVKITPSKEDGNLLAFANITLGGCFAVRGIRVMDSEKGVFVAMPDKKNAKGEYHNVCFPTTAEMRQALNTAVLTEYQKVMEQLSIFVEHAIRFINRFRILSERYRNRGKRFSLRFSLIAGICNFDRSA